MTKRLFSLLMSAILLIGAFPLSAVHAQEEEWVEIPIPVSTEGKTYSLFTEQYLDELHGVSFLYVIKRDGHFYTPAHPGFVGEYKEVDSVPAIDITAYWDEDTNTFSAIPDSAGVGVLQYQSYPFPEYGGQGLYLDGNILFALSVPFEDDGTEWFGTIDYYDRDQTYSYSRALWNATGDGSGYFYDAYYDWQDEGNHVFGALALNGNRFALRNFSEEFNALEDGQEPQFDVGGYLYAAPCGHAATEYSAYVAPTCMDKGCKEYWYCVYCNGYFADEACTDAYGHKPVLPALEHWYDDTACVHCGREIPVYTRISSYEQFCTVDENASFIAVAELDDGNGGKEYYVLKQPLNIVNSDIDEDGTWDILLIDEDQNGVSDVLEQDLDGDGVADAMRVDGFWSEETLDGVLDDMEIEQYLFELEMEYTGGYMPGSSLLQGISVTPDARGGITVKNMGAMEFVMERVIPDDQLLAQYYGDGATKMDYENDFRFRVPNFWIRPMVVVDNNFYQMPYEQGDSRWWGVLFGDDAKKEKSEFFDETYPDDAVVLYTEQFYSRNFDGELEHGLRFLVNGEEKNFWITSYSYWEETVGTEIPIYLYCSDAGGDYHEHVFGAWSKLTDEIHKRVCTVEGCTEYDLAGHTPDPEGERIPDTDNPSLGHWVACTDCGENIHEYHTREEYNYRYDMWRDAEDGVHHYVNCEICGGVAVYEEHDWNDWVWNGLWNNETKQYDYMHRRTCDCFPCPAEQWSTDCIYGEGVVTVAPTCISAGEITYTCVVESCTMESHTYTEVLPALGHDWNEGVITAEPTYDAEGLRTYTCTACGESKTETIDRLIKVDEIVLPENEEIRVCVPDGSDAILDADTVLTVAVVEELFPEQVGDSVREQLGEDAQILTAYEITLLLDGAEYDPRGKLEVTLPVPDEAKGFASVAVAFIDEDGNAVPCVTNKNGDGTLTFETDHFSTYAIVGVDPIPAFVYGDVGGDGIINGKDVTRLLRYLAYFDPTTGTSDIEISQGADCDGDGVVNGKDVTRLLRYLANLDPVTGESSVRLGK